MSDDEKREMPFITKAIIIGVLAVVVIIVMAVMGNIIVSSAVEKAMKSGKEQEEVAKPEPVKKQELSIGLMLPFGEYTVNLKDKEPRYLVCEVQLEFDDSGKDKGADVLSELVGKEGPTSIQVVAQDRIIGILGNRTVEDLRADLNQRVLKDEIVNSLQPLLKKGTLKNVYFVKWVVQ